MSERGRTFIRDTGTEHTFVQTITRDDEEITVVYGEGDWSCTIICDGHSVDIPAVMVGALNMVLDELEDWDREHQP